MIIERDLKNFFQELGKQNMAALQVDGADVTVRLFEDASKLLLSTPVFEGENYIPESVRSCVSASAPFDQGRIPTQVSIDEEKFQVQLNYVGLTDKINNTAFLDLLQEFCWLADEWRFYLDEHDRKDRIHVPVK